MNETIERIKEGFSLLRKDYRFVCLSGILDKKDIPADAEVKTYDTSKGSEAGYVKMQNDPPVDGPMFGAVYLPLEGEDYMIFVVSDKTKFKESYE